MPIIYGGKGKLLGGAAVVPWYLAVGVDAADCVSAFQAIGAASYAGSKVNLVTPGTGDLAEVNGSVAWAAETGWTRFGNGSTRYLDTGITIGANRSYFIRGNFIASSYQGLLVAGANDYNGTFGVWPDWEGTAFAFLPNLATVGAKVNGDHVIAISGGTIYIDGVVRTTNLLTGSGTLRVFGADYQGNIFAESNYNKNLTLAQVIGLSNKMATLP
jgi:hypothetical protein